MFVLELFFLLGIIYSSSATIVLKPIHSNGTETGVILFQGDKINAKKYINFAQQLQKTSQSTRLWVAIAEFPSDKPNKYRSDNVINDVLDDFRKEGFNMNETTPFYFIGHSIGGNVLQDYILNNKLTGNFQELELEYFFVIFYYKFCIN